MPQTIDNLSATWNNAGTTFTAFKFNITDTASNAASLLMDLQVGGTSRFNVSKAGAISSAVTGASPAVLSAANFKIYSNSYFAVESGGGIAMTLERNTATGLRIGSTMPIGWASTVDAWNNAPDLFLTRRAAANLRFGAADAAAPVAQTLSVQSVVAGTTNTAGANLTITGSQGTGTGAGGSIVFQVAPAGSSGTAQNALSTALTIDSTGLSTFSLGISTPAGSNGAIPVRIGAVNTGFYRGSTQGGQAIVSSVAGTDIFAVGQNSSIGVVNIGPYSWASTIGSTADVLLYRDAANTLALRNGANAQTFRVYNTTDGTNSEFASLYWAGNTAYLLSGQAGTGSFRNMAIGTTGGSATLTFWTNGSERWRFDGSGHLLAIADNSYDIGAFGANRPRNLYLGSSIVLPASGVIIYDGRAEIRSYASGNLTFWNSAGTDFGRLQFGGTSSSFPAIKRSSTTLQARLADDSAFAPVQGKLTTDTAYAAGDPTTTGYLVVYDSTGTAYKIPAVAV